MGGGQTESELERKRQVGRQTATQTKRQRERESCRVADSLTDFTRRDMDNAEEKDR